MTQFPNFRNNEEHKQFNDAWLADRANVYSDLREAGINIPTMEQYMAAAEKRSHAFIEAWKNAHGNVDVDEVVNENQEIINTEIINNDNEDVDDNQEEEVSVNVNVEKKRSTAMQLTLWSIVILTVFGCMQLGSAAAESMNNGFMASIVSTGVTVFTSTFAISVEWFCKVTFIKF